MNDKQALIKRKQSIELEEIFSELEDSGRGRTVLVSGEAGTGKTLLVKHFIETAYEKSGRKLVSGYGFGVDLSGSIRSYHPWKEAVIDIDTNLLTLHFLHGHPQKEVDYKKVIKSAFEGTGTDWIKAIPQIGNISSLIYKSVIEIKEGISEQKIANAIKKISEGITFNSAESLFETMSAKLRGISEKYPLIIFIDDLQWIDNSSRDLFLYLAQNLNQSPYSLLLIGTYRTEYLASSDNNANENEPKLSELLRSLKKFAEPLTIEVSKITNEEAGNLITLKYPSNLFSKKFSNELQNISGGNIAIFCQILENLEESGDIKESDGKFIYDKAESLSALPSELNDLFLEKWERLSEDVRSILRIASVMGEDFSVEIISELLEEKKLKLFSKIESAKNEHRLIIGSEKEYGKLNMIFQFKNALFRKFVYETIDEQFRSEYHKQIAEALSKSYNNIEQESIFPQYINHYGIGGGIVNSDGKIVADKSLLEDDAMRSVYDQYLKMMEKLADRYAGSVSNEESLSCYDILFRLTKEVDDRDANAKFSMLKGKILTELGRNSEAETVFKHALSVATEFSNDSLLADSNFYLGNLYKRKNNFDAATKQLNIALQEYESLDNKTGTSLSLLNLGNISFKLGKIDAAMAKTKRAVELLEGTEDERNLAMAYLQLGNLHISNKEYVDAEKLFLRGLEISQKTGDLRVKALFISQRGVLNFKKGLIENSLEKYSEALEIQERISNVRSVAILLNNIALANHYLGNRDKSRELYLKAKTAMEMLGDSKSIADILYNIADLEYIDGQYSDALSYANRSIETLLSSGLENELTKILNLRSKIERDQNDRTRALVSAKEGEKYSAFSSDPEKLRNKMLLLTLDSGLNDLEIRKGLDEIISITSDKEIIAEAMIEKALVSKDMGVTEVMKILDAEYRESRNPAYSKLRERIAKLPEG